MGLEAGGARSIFLKPRLELKRRCAAVQLVPSAHRRSNAATWRTQSSSPSSTEMLSTGEMRYLPPSCSFAPDRSASLPPGPLPLSFDEGEDAARRDSSSSWCWSGLPLQACKWEQRAAMQPRASSPPIQPPVVSRPASTAEDHLDRAAARLGRLFSPGTYALESQVPTDLSRLEPFEPEPPRSVLAGYRADNWKPASPRNNGFYSQEEPAVSSSAPPYLAQYQGSSPSPTRPSPMDDATLVYSASSSPGRSPCRCCASYCKSNCYGS